MMSETDHVHLYRYTRCRTERQKKNCFFLWTRWSCWLYL